MFPQSLQRISHTVFHGDFEAVYSICAAVRPQPRNTAKMTELYELIVANFDPAKAQELDVIVGVVAPPDRFVFSIRDAALTPLDPAVQPHFSLLFSSQAIAIAMLNRRIQPIDAFMAQDFSSDGYIVTCFRVLAALNAYP